MLKMILISLLMVMMTAPALYAKDSSFTQEDRERLIRLEEGLKANNQRFDAMNQRFDAVNLRIDDLRKELKDDIGDLKDELSDLMAFMLWGFGILFGGMGMLMGFVIWDRRTTLAPVAKANRALEEREEKIEKVLRALAQEDPRFAAIMKREGLME